MGKSITVVTVDNLRYYHNLMIEYIDKRLDLVEKRKTNCPNCGAPISTKTCPYCNTNLIDWYKK